MARGNRSMLEEPLGERLGSFWVRIFGEDGRSPKGEHGIGTRDAAVVPSWCIVVAVIFGEYTSEPLSTRMQPSDPLSLRGPWLWPILDPLSEKIVSPTQITSSQGSKINIQADLAWFGRSTWAVLPSLCWFPRAFPAVAQDSYSEALC